MLFMSYLSVKPEITEGLEYESNGLGRYRVHRAPRRRGAPGARSYRGDRHAQHETGIEEAAGRVARLRAARNPLRIAHHALRLEAPAGGHRRRGQRGWHPARARPRDLRP